MDWSELEHAIAMAFWRSNVLSRHEAEQHAGLAVDIMRRHDRLLSINPVHGDPEKRLAAMNRLTLAQMGEV